MQLIIMDLPPDSLLTISPYNALGYGLAVAILTWVVGYFKQTLVKKEKIIHDKDKIIGELIDKNHKAYDAISEKLTEIKTQNLYDRQAVIHDLTIIKKALEI